MSKAIEIYEHSRKVNGEWEECPFTGEVEGEMWENEVQYYPAGYSISRGYTAECPLCGYEFSADWDYED